VLSTKTASNDSRPGRREAAGRHRKKGAESERPQAYNFLVELGSFHNATPTVGVKNFLVTHWGKPYTAPGFGNWFRELCDAAGCHGLSAHGLRKAAARRLAEIGCSALQIAAITGHATLKEVSRYTKAADRKRMASEAITKLNEHGW